MFNSKIIVPESNTMPLCSNIDQITVPSFVDCVILMHFNPIELGIVLHLMVTQTARFARFSIVTNIIEEFLWSTDGRVAPCWQNY